MGRYLGPAPGQDIGWDCSSEEQMLRHAFREARAEVESWFSGERYEWTPFCSNDGPLRIRYVDVSGGGLVLS